MIKNLAILTDNELQTLCDNTQKTMKHETDHMWAMLEADNAQLASLLWEKIQSLIALLHNIDSEMNYRENSYALWGLVA